MRFLGVFAMHAAMRYYSPETVLQMMCDAWRALPVMQSHWDYCFTRHNLTGIVLCLALPEGICWPCGIGSLFIRHDLTNDAWKILVVKQFMTSRSLSNAMLPLEGISTSGKEKREMSSTGYLPCWLLICLYLVFRFTFTFWAYQCLSLTSVLDPHSQKFIWSVICVCDTFFVGY